MVWDIRAAVNEKLFHSLIGHIRSQRPSNFNFATQAIFNNPGFFCSTITPPLNGSPIATLIDPLVIGETSRQKLLADYCYQIPELSIDFYPGTDLPEKRFSMTIALQLGLGFPDFIDNRFLLLPDNNDEPVKQEEMYLPYDTLKCYSVSVKSIGSSKWVWRSSKLYLVLQVESLIFEDSEDVPLADLISQYLLTTLNASILPGMALGVAPLEIDAPDQGAPIIVPMTPTPGLDNPTFAGDHLEAFLDLA